MNRFSLVLALLLLTLASCGGDDPAPGPEDVTSGDTTYDGLSEFCKANPGEMCDDEDPCTLGEGICTGGECLFGNRYACDTPPSKCDSDGLCDGSGGCIWKLAPGYCRIEGACVTADTVSPDNSCLKCLPEENRSTWTPLDGDTCAPADKTCTPVGVCEQGFCAPKVTTAECALDADCAKKDDGNLCNGVFKCQSCSCAFDSSSVVTCDGSGDTPCAQNTCNPLSGKCAVQVTKDGNNCEDGDICTGDDYCSAGKCVAGLVTEHSWTRLVGPVGARMDELVAWPLASERFIAAGRGGSVYVSNDAGETWAPGPIMARGDASADWLTVGTGQNPVLLVIIDKTIFRSADGGGQWSARDDNCEALVEYYDNPDNFIAICGKRVKLSSVGGADWTDSGYAAPGTFKTLVTGLLAGKDGVWFMGTASEDSSGRGRLYTTPNRGMSWTGVDLFDQPVYSAIAPHGILRIGGDNPKIFVGLAATRAGVFEEGRPRFFRSDDGGQTFNTMNTSLEGSSFVPLALDNQGRLLLAADDRIYAIPEGGSGEPHLITPPGEGLGLRLHPITRLVIDPANAFRYLVPASDGIVSVENDGLVWTLLNEGMQAGSFDAVFQTAAGSILGAEAQTALLYRSVDTQGHWDPTDLAEGHDLHHVDSIAQSVDGLLAATTMEGGLALSQDSGNTWSYRDPTIDPPFAPVSAMALGLPPVETAPHYLYAFVQGIGLWRHENGGVATEDVAWKLLPVPVSEAGSVVTDPRVAGAVYVSSMNLGSGNARLYRSADFGDTWALKLEAEGLGFKVFAEQGGLYRYLAALMGNKPALYQSGSSGSTWSTLGKAPTFANVRQDTCILPPSDATLSPLAALWLSGIWRFDPDLGQWMLIKGSPRTVVSLARDKTDKGRIYAADGASPRLLVSSDEGASFQLLKDFGAGFVRVRKVVTMTGLVAAMLDSSDPFGGKLFLLENGQWKERSVGLPGDVLDLEERPLEDDSTELLASTLPAGLYRSADLGQTWTAVETFPVTAALDLTVSPSNPQIVVAAVTCGALPEGALPGDEYQTACGVLRSDDGGVTWAQKVATSRACHALDSRVAGDTTEMYAACDGAGLFRSINEGATWQNITLSVSMFSSTSQTLSDVAVWGNHLALGTSDTGPYLASGPVEAPSSITWISDAKARIRPALEDIEIIVDPLDSARFIINAVPGGIYVSDDNASHWSDGNGKIPPDLSVAKTGLPVRINFVHLTGQTRFWAAAAGGGLWTSADGFFWHSINTGDPQIDDAVPVRLQEARSNWLGETRRVWLLNENGVFLTDNGGDSWSDKSEGLPAGRLMSFARAVEERDYISVSGDQIYYLDAGQPAWLRAETIKAFGVAWPQWDNRNLGYWSHLLPDPNGLGRFWMASDPTGLWNSTDAGNHWEKVSGGLPPGPVYCVAFDHQNPLTMYAGTGFGPYTSADAGESFQALSSSWPANAGALLDFHQSRLEPNLMIGITVASPTHGTPASGGPEESYAARALLLSRDRGLNWESCGAGPTETAGLMQVLSDPYVTGTFYLVTAQEGVFISEDYCSTWESWNAGLPGPYTGADGLLRGKPLRLSFTEDRFYLGTAGFGIYERILDSLCK